MWTNANATEVGEGSSATKVRGSIITNNYNLNKCIMINIKYK